MLKQGCGHIVNTSSIFGKLSVHSVTYYSAAKFALNGLMDSLRFEVSIVLYTVLLHVGTGIYQYVGLNSFCSLLSLLSLRTKGYTSQTSALVP